MNNVPQISYAQLWKNGQYFAQISKATSRSVTTNGTSDGSLIGDVLAVASNLVGDAYELKRIGPDFKPSQGLEVYDILTEVLPTLSPQSKFYWERGARTLASQLASAKYPIRSQTSHLLFWWARLGGLMGTPTLQQHPDYTIECTSDGSTVEFSWAVPRDSDPSDESNFRLRFTIDLFHPETGHRLAGGAVLEWLWSDEGGLGLIKRDTNGKVWKDELDKWLFPDIENTEEVVAGNTYFIAFDMEPSGIIMLKKYYIPPPSPMAETKLSTTVTACRLTSNWDCFVPLLKALHPSLERPYQILYDYLTQDGKDAGQAFVMIAVDLVKPEKNRLKIYTVTPKLSLKAIIRDMTLGGRLKGPRVDEAMKNFRKFISYLFPYIKDDESEFILNRNSSGSEDISHVPRKEVRIMYYYEFFVGEPVPYPKIYFFMDHFSINDWETARATERFLHDAGKPGPDTWMTDALSRANSHRGLDERNGLHTMVSFGTKPSGWEVTNYYSAEFHASERERRQC